MMQTKHAKRFALIATLFVAACGSTQPEIAALAWSTPRESEAPVGGADTTLPDLAGGSDLGELLALALARNPRIQAAREKALASAETGAIESALPDPRILLGWYATPVETRVGPQEFSLGIQQSVPFPSKLRVRSELGDTLAKRERIAFERVVRNALVEVVHAAHELIYIDAAIRISGRIAPLLERYTVAAAKGETGTAVPELFRAETQRAQLENDRVVLIELRAVEAERLRSLLDLPPDAPVGTPRTGRVPRVDARFDELLAIARAHNQEVREAGLSVEAAALRTSLARKNRLPDLTFGYTHIFTGELPTSIGTPVGSGDDAQIVHFGFTVPLWASKNSAEIRRARALERRATQDRRDVALRLRPRLARAWFQVGNARRLVDLYDQVLIPRAEQAVKTTEDLHAAGKGSLAGTIETVAVLHNFRLAAARAGADYGQAVATLEAVLGRPLAPAAKNEQENKEGEAE
ncbi:MAG: TolC family protein [Planctomycetota bacterium]|jgi:outer membrane protein TolC